MQLDPDWNDRDAAEDKLDYAEMQVRRDSPSGAGRDAFIELKDQLRDELAAEPEPELDLSEEQAARAFVYNRLDPLLEKRGIVLNRSEKRQLLEAIVADLTRA